MGDSAFYAVKYKDSVALENSKLGVIMEDIDFSQGLSIEEVTDNKKIEDHYTMSNGKRLERNYKANQSVFHLKNKEGKKMALPNSFSTATSLGKQFIWLRYKV